MKMTYKIFGASIALAASLAVSATPARAQVETAAAAVAAPIVSNVISSVAQKKAAKGNWLKAEVVHADSHSIIVREQANSLAIHAFTYAPQLQDTMQKAEDQSGYQYGDKVKILFHPGDTVALKINGKPSSLYRIFSPARFRNSGCVTTGNS